MEPDRKQSSEDLTLSSVEEFYDPMLKAVLESSLIAVTLVNRNGQIIYASQLACEILGLTVSQAENRRYNSPEWKISDWEGNPIPDNKLPFHLVVKKGLEVRDFRHAIIWPNGKRRLLSINGQSIVNGKGELCGLFTLRDVTELAETRDARRKDLTRLRDSEEMLAKSEVIAKIGSWSWHLETGKVEYSKQMLKLCGFDQTDFDGRIETAFSLIHPDDIERVSEETRRGLEELDPQPMEYRMVLPSGEVRHVWGSGAYQFDSEGKPYRMIGCIQDVTERKLKDAKLLEQSERLQLALEGTDLGIWDWHVPSGSVVFNEQWAKMLGYELHELEPNVKTWSRLVHPDDYDDVVKTLEKHMTGETPYYETDHRVLAKNGEWKWIHDRGKVVERDESGKPIRATGIHKDVDLRKRAELKLAEAKKAAEDANQSKSEFVANMSHELRSPLTAILGFTEIIAKQEKPEPRYVEAIKRNGNYLLQLISDILDLSRMEANRVKIECSTFNVHDLMHEVVSSMSVRAQESNLKFRLEFDGTIPQQIHTDQVRLQQILINLVGNAIKFTDFGEIRICVNSMEQMGEPFLCFDVIDTGIGIDEEKIGKLFSPFVQLDTSNKRRKEGLGLGLAISRRLARLLGGDINVDSQLGRGSTFRLVVPVSGAVSESVPSSFEKPANESAALEEKKLLDEVEILLVEDGVDNQHIFEFVLKAAGARVQVASNGRIALEKVSEFQQAGRSFDAIIMDMQMPEMDGYEATRHLRQSGNRTPIIALTAYAMNSDRARCVEVGCSDYATKPVDLNGLVQMIAKHIGLETDGSSEAAA